MPPKKRQHLVPACYLESFVDPTPPEGVPLSIYEPAIWIKEKSFDSEPKRRSPSNALWEPYFYNLDSDEPERPLVENFLAAIESDYSTVLRNIKGGITLEWGDLIKLSVFVDTLFRRTPEMVDWWQEQIDDIESLYRQVDRAHSGNEIASDMYWQGSHEASKRLIVDGTGALARLLLDAGITIVKNDSDMLFFTSDSPVTYNFLHIDELLGYSVPQEWMRRDVGTNRKWPFCYCPLTPQFALLSSPFILSTSAYTPRVTTDSRFAVGMNFLTLELANTTIVSSTREPFGKAQEQAVAARNLARQLKRRDGVRMRVYTNRARYEVAVLNRPGFVGDSKL